MKLILAVVGVLGLFVMNVSASLPAGWIDAPFGLYTLGLEGGSWFDDATTVTVSGSGQGFGGSPPSTDGGRYVFRRLQGDCELVADVPLLSREILNDDARAGLLIRSSGDRHDRFAGLMRQPGTETEPARVRFQHRSAKGTNSGSQTPVAGVAQGTTNYLSNYDMPVIRMRLVRQGSKLYGYLSTNESETAWFKAYDATITLGEDVLAGLFVNRAAVRQVEVMTNTFSNVTVRELVTATRNAIGDRRVVDWATDLPEVPEGASYRLSYSTSYTGAFILLADGVTPPYETASDWMTGTSLYFRVQAVTPGATNLLGTSGACALRQAQPVRAAPAQNGLWAAYYAPASATVPIAERLETAVDDNWTNTVAGLGGENFRVVFNGAVTPEESGLYVFGSEADDTMQVSLDAVPVLEDIYANDNGMVSVSKPVWLEAGRSYGLRVEYQQATGDKRAFLQWARQADNAFSPVPVSALTPFPTEWSQADIGAVDVGGYAEYDWDAAAFTVAGTGMGIGGTADSFRYAWRERTGDFDLTARVALSADNAAQATAGLLFRESAAANAVGAGVYLVEGADTVQVVALARTATDGATQTLATGPSFAKGQAVFLSITRTGHTLTFACRADGEGVWTPVGSVLMALPPSALVGMAVVSGDPATPVAAVFDTLGETAYATVDLSPSADTYVQNGSPDTSFGSGTTLQIKRQDALYTREAFMMFDLRRQAPVRSALLRLYVVTNTLGLANDALAFRRVVDSRWTESDLTWSNPPAGYPLPSAYLDTLDPLWIGTANVPGIGEWVEFDLTAAVNRAIGEDGVLSFGISSLTINNSTSPQLSLAAREHGTASLRPRLAVVPAAVGTPTVRLGDSGTQAEVSWEAFAGATAYRVWRATGTPEGFEQVSGDLSGLSFSQGGLTSGQVYHYAVTALTGQGETPRSPSASLAATAQAVVTNAPLADTYVQGGSSRNNNYGGNTTLVLKNEGFKENDYAREAFLRFDVDGFGGAEKAVLSLTISATASGTIPRVMDVWLAPDSAWSETAVTYANPPAGITLPTTQRTSLPADGSVIRVALVPSIANTNLLIDITEMVRMAGRAGAGMTLGLNRVDTDTSVTISFYSKEATGVNTNRIPRLIVTSVRPGVPQAESAAGGLALSWPLFRGAVSYTVRRAETREGEFAVVASGLETPSCEIAQVSGWFTVSAVTAGGETPQSDPVYLEKRLVYEERLPLADTGVESGGNANANYGQAQSASLKATPSAPTRENFFRFDVSGLDRVRSARLRLNVAATGNPYPASAVLIYDEIAGEWNENIVTWNTMIPGLIVPRANSAPRAANELARIPYPVRDQNFVSYIEADVTEAVRAAAAAGRQSTFRLCGDTVTTASQALWQTAFKENVTAARRPVLLVDAGTFGAPSGARVVENVPTRNGSLAWSAVPGAATYTVRRLLAGGGHEVVAEGLTETALDLGALPNDGTRFTYEVVAVRADGTVSEPAQLEVSIGRQQAFTVLADSYIRGGDGASVVYGAEKDMVIKRDQDPQYNRQAYLRLPGVKASALKQAVVRLRVAAVNDSAMTLVAQAVADTGWTESGEEALTWANAPVTRLEDATSPVAGELWRGSVAGVTLGTTVEMDVTAGLKAFLAAHPEQESVVVHVFSATQDGTGAKQVSFVSKEGAMLPEYAPSVEYTVNTYPPQGTVIWLK